MAGTAENLGGTMNVGRHFNQETFDTLLCTSIVHRLRAADVVIKRNAQATDGIVARLAPMRDEALRAVPTATSIVHLVADHCESDSLLFVADVNRALRFYIDKLGFEKCWHEGDGAGGVCQVHRVGCEIILCEDATRRDKARLFVALNVDGLTAFRREIVERSVPTEKSWWGYDVIKIVDPDGNELLFPAAE